MRPQVRGGARAAAAPRRGARALRGSDRTLSSLSLLSRSHRPRARRARAFFKFPPGGGWQEEPLKRGRPEPPTFAKPFEAEGVVYLPFRGFFHAEGED